TDESGDARVFTQELARRCAQAGVEFLYEHDVLGFGLEGGRVGSVQVQDRRTGRRRALKADAHVAALGSYTAPLLRPLGISLNIYPAKGYS
ncbi:FAD-dependent oxidoreductase, partial [Escherichia coli]|nr:FAD-dependent oxidoreductase [Escherichia coli]